jgi:tetratricopeptide (TPR) repeat protein
VLCDSKTFAPELNVPTLGLCTITKDAAATLPACLRSARRLVDAMVVVDTGSTDASTAIARAAGATVIHFPWTNDFAAARNVGLQALDTDWILVLDADEELDRKAHGWIGRELKSPKADGHVTPVRNYQRPWDEPLAFQHPVAPDERHPRAPDARTYVHSQVCRLFRNDPDIYYTGPIHEQVEYRMLELGRPLLQAGFFIHHFGWYLMAEEDFTRKRAFYRDLLAEKLKQTPDDRQVLVQYGDALSYQSSTLDESLACFMKAVELDSSDRETWLHIAAVLLKKGQPKAALIAIEQAAAEYPGRAAQLRGDAFGALRRWSDAREAFLLALQHYPGYSGLQAKLALVEMQTDDCKEGLKRMRDVIRAAEDQAEKRPRPDAYLRAAMLHAQMSQWVEVLALADRGLALAPGSQSLHELRLRAAVATGALHQAAESAGAIAARAQTPRAALRHASILSQAGDHAAAADAIARGLSAFPDSTELVRAGQELHSLQPAP